MVTHEDNEEDAQPLHDKLKAVEMAFRRATDDLEATRLAFRDDASDRNRIKVWQAKMKLLEASELRDELLDEISEEDDDLDSGWSL